MSQSSAAVVMHKPGWTSPTSSGQPASTSIRLAHDDVFQAHLADTESIAQSEEFPPVPGPDRTINHPSFARLSEGSCESHL
jgi:hypothetical protein